MGSLKQKLEYTLKSIQDITKALEEAGLDMSSVELKQYGNFIRNLSKPDGEDSGSSLIYGALDITQRVHFTKCFLLSKITIEQIESIE